MIGAELVLCEMNTLWLLQAKTIFVISHSGNNPNSPKRPQMLWNTFSGAEQNAVGGRRRGNCVSRELQRPSYFNIIFESSEVLGELNKHNYGFVLLMIRFHSSRFLLMSPENDSSYKMHGLGFFYFVWDWNHTRNSKVGEMPINCKCMYVLGETKMFFTPSSFSIHAFKWTSRLAGNNWHTS